MLEATLSTQPTAYWLELLEQAGVVAGPIYDMKQVYDDPQVRARDMVVDLEDDDLGVLRHIGVPIKLSETPGSVRNRAPALGEHSREILKGAGFDTTEIEALIGSGTVLCQ